MKIAIVFEIFYPTINGVITSSVNLAENLTQLGHDVVFVAPKTPQFCEPVVGRRNIPVRYIPSIGNYMYPGMRTTLPWNRRIYRTLVREGVDVLHITGPWLLSWAAMRAARDLGIPVVHTFHTMLHERSYIQYVTRTAVLVPALQLVVWNYNGMYIRRSTVMTGPSRYVCRQLRRHFPHSDIRHISNGIDVARFTTFDDLEAVRTSYPWADNQTFLYVGRLGQEKSIDQLIRAMSHVREIYPSALLLIVGDGPNRAEYARLARALDLERHVTFLGRIPHGDLLASGLIHHARAFVTASTTENQPMTVIEAICCSTPVIVPDVDGINELVDRNGLRYRANDVYDLAAAMVRIIDDDELHGACRAAARTMADQFDGRTVARRFASLYEEVTSSPRG